MKEFIKRLDESDAKKFHILKWIDKLFGGNLFGYAPHYSLTHPHVLFMDLCGHINWAWQRVYRRWDDRAAWSIDYWLNEIMPDIISQLKRNTHGTPMSFYEGFPHDKNFDYSDEDESKARELWNAELDKMIAGFVASKRMHELEYKTKEQFEREYEILESIFKNGMKSFTEYYHSLWD